MRKKNSVYVWVYIPMITALLIGFGIGQMDWWRPSAVSADEEVIINNDLEQLRSESMWFDGQPISFAKIGSFAENTRWHLDYGQVELAKQRVLQAIAYQPTGADEKVWLESEFDDELALATIAEHYELGSFVKFIDDFADDMKYVILETLNERLANHGAFSPDVAAVNADAIRAAIILAIWPLAQQIWYQADDSECLHQIVKWAWTSQPDFLDIHFFESIPKGVYVAQDATLRSFYVLARSNTIEDQDLIKTILAKISTRQRLFISYDTEGGEAVTIEGLWYIEKFAGRIKLAAVERARLELDLLIFEVGQSANFSELIDQLRDSPDGSQQKTARQLFAERLRRRI